MTICFNEISSSSNRKVLIKPGIAYKKCIVYVFYKSNYVLLKSEFQAMTEFH